MRVLLFDSILESHVSASFQSALEARGHEVMSTGKIGHGFQFPRSYEGIDHLRLAVRNGLAWAPDWVFVFRPASLPVYLLNEFRAAGIKVAAWFSDDPVLFDLSYGPVLDAYDLVLHCGNARVLEFYEARFGRPTGVNFPFWTDARHFPYVWGKEDFETDLLFLGNVGDKVRRRRYFDLARIASTVRIHGNIGTDYFGLSGGYLDSDAEVVNAGGRALAALNIPQYFRDHRGLETWFGGLDLLGFFEYPSRVVQYMAMGMPVVSVIEEAPRFETFPEMRVVPSIAAVDDVVEELRDEATAQELSSRTHARFLRYFTADSRVRVFERLVVDDSWKALSAKVRARWFVDAIDASRGDEEIHPDELGAYGSRERVVVSDALPRSVSKQATPRVDRDGQSAIGQIPASQVLASDETEVYAGSVVYLVGTGWTRPYSRIMRLRRALESLGVTVKAVNPASRRDLFHEGGPHGIKYWFNEERLLEEVQGCRWLLVVDLSVALKESTAEALSDAGVGTFAWAPSLRRWGDPSREAARRYDLLGFSYNDDVKMAEAEGFQNVLLTHDVVDREFQERVCAESQEGDTPAIKWFTGNPAADDAFSSLRLNDLASVASEDLRALSEDTSLTDETLLARLRCGVAVVSHAGTRAHPRLAELVPYVVAAADVTFFVRAGTEVSLEPYAGAVLYVREPGELNRKLRRLNSSPSLMSLVETGKRKLLGALVDAPSQVSRILKELDEAVARKRSSRMSDGISARLTQGAWSRSVRLVDLVPKNGREVALRISLLDRALPGSSCRVLVNGPTGNLFSGTVNDELRLTVGASDSDYSQIAVVVDWSDLSPRVANSVPPRVAITPSEVRRLGRSLRHLPTPWVSRSI